MMELKSASSSASAVPTDKRDDVAKLQGELALAQVGVAT